MISMRKIKPLIAAALMLPLAACQSGNPTAVLRDARAGAQTTAAGGTWNGPQAGLIAPFREAQFAYRKPLEITDGGRFLKLPYDEARDINQRDEVPVRKVRSWYTSPLPAGSQREGEYGSRKLKYHAIGALEGGSKITVVYLHGRGGNRDWGFDDERFGGNFNRLKHLMLKSGGLYVSPDFTDFEATGFADVKELLAKLRPLTAGKLVVACGSLGNSHCWSIARDAKAASMVDGMIVLAGFPDSGVAGSALLRNGRRSPLVLVHGTWDPTFDYKPMVDLYGKVREQAPDHPVRFLLFETGRHGAPVRMIDWRDTLNWIASR